MLPVGGKIIVETVIFYSMEFGLSEAFLSAFLIAFGTSLPELATCIVASIKKQADLIVGNIIGSNIFNILFILSVSAFINPIVYQLFFNLESVIIVVYSVLLLILSKIHKSIFPRYASTFFLLSYIAYIILIYFRG